MRISLIIPTLNAGSVLEELLSRLRKQDCGPIEVIIIDSSSEDNTVNIAESFGARTIVIPRSDFNHGRTRNVAVLEAAGDVFVFMTQDAVPCDETLLRRLVAPLHRPDIAASYGRHIPRPDAAPPEIFARSFNYPDVPLIKGVENIEKYGVKAFFFSNVCSAIRKEAFFSVGMFPEVRFNEDMLIAAKFLMGGYKIAYVPEARVIHSHNYSLLKQFRRYYEIGSSLKGNGWIVRLGRTEGEGMKFIRGQMRFVLNHQRYLWIPYVFLESAAKYIGYRLGLLAR